MPASPSQIKLTLPAEPQYARSVRMLAANLATLCGMTIDDVEDVRMAAEEGFVFSCATQKDELDVTFEVSESQIAIGFALGDEDAAPAEQAVYARLLLEAVCDEFELSTEASTLHLLKRAGA